MHSDDIGQHSYSSTEFWGRSKDKGASSEIVYEGRKRAKNMQMVLMLNLSENASLIVYFSDMFSFCHIQVFFAQF